MRGSGWVKKLSAISFQLSALSNFASPSKACPGEPYRGYLESLDNGADTFLPEPVEPPVLVAVATALVRASRGGAKTGKASTYRAASSARLAQAGQRSNFGLWERSPAQLVDYRVLSRVHGTLARATLTRPREEGLTAAEPATVRE